VPYDYSNEWKHQEASPRLSLAGTRLHFDGITPPGLSWQLFLKGIVMLYTIAVVLIILWLLGLVSSYTMGGFIHVLLVIAIVVILLNLISGRKLT
jgi:hypothetical protein